MENEDERVKLTINEAIALLPDKEQIHTFRNPSGTLVGTDWSREELIKAIEIYGGAKLTGETASSMHHGIAIEWKDDWLFIETIDNKVNQNSIDKKQEDDKQIDEYLREVTEIWNEPVIDEFTQKMLEEYIRHFKEKGDSWKEIEIEELRMTLLKTCQRWEAMITRYPKLEADELVDMGLVASFLFWRICKG